jgi:hypothetical protein
MVRRARRSVADPATRQSNCHTRPAFAERKPRAAPADRRRHAGFAEVQADAREQPDATEKAQGHAPVCAWSATGGARCAGRAAMPRQRSRRKGHHGEDAAGAHAMTKAKGGAEKGSKRNGAFGRFVIPFAGFGAPRPADRGRPCGSFVSGKRPTLNARRVLARKAAEL